MNSTKKVLFGTLAAAILSTAAAIPAMAADDISVILNGQQISFDVPPQIINERTMVPVRAIFEALGAVVEWDGSTQTVNSSKNSVNISMKIGDTTMYVNGKAVALDSPPCVIDERTLVPVRAIAESFGINVDWDGTTSSVYLTDPSSDSSLSAYERLEKLINTKGIATSSGTLMTVKPNSYRTVLLSTDNDYKITIVINDTATNTMFSLFLSPTDTPSVNIMIKGNGMYSAYYEGNTLSTILNTSRTRSDSSFESDVNIYLGELQALLNQYSIRLSDVGVPM